MFYFLSIHATYFSLQTLYGLSRYCFTSETHFLRFLPFMSLCCSLPFSSLPCEILQKTRLWEMGCHSLLLCTLSPYTGPCHWSPSWGWLCVHLTTCPSSGYLGKPMLPGEVHVAVLASSLVGWAVQSTLRLKYLRSYWLTDLLSDTSVPVVVGHVILEKIRFLWQLLVVSTDQSSTGSFCIELIL